MPSYGMGEAATQELMHQELTKIEKLMEDQMQIDDKDFEFTRIERDIEFARRRKKLLSEQLSEEEFNSTEPDIKVIKFQMRHKSDSFDIHAPEGYELFDIRDCVETINSLSNPTFLVYTFKKIKELSKGF